MIDWLKTLYQPIMLDMNSNFSSVDGTHMKHVEATETDVKGCRALIGMLAEVNFSNTILFGGNALCPPLRFLPPRSLDNIIKLFQIERRCNYLAKGYPMNCLERQSVSVIKRNVGGGSPSGRGGRSLQPFWKSVIDRVVGR